MIGERSDQMVLLPFISPGPARLACAEGRRRPSRRRVRAPPHNHGHQDQQDHLIGMRS
jgi:hypothetical protein